MRCILLFLYLTTCTLSQVSLIVPRRYLYPTDETVSVNGSSPVGNCSSVSSFNFGLSSCTAPNSSVLFDGNIPPLTGLDGDMWASQLFTLQTHNSSRREITLDFTSPDYAGVKRVELLMFNCPEWGLAVENIEYLEAKTRVTSKFLVGTFSPTITSCDLLVGVCISHALTEPVITLRFIPAPGSNRTYLAEVGFYGDSSVCPPDINIPPIQEKNIPEATQEESATPSISPSSSPIIVIAASMGCVVLLIVCLLAAMLILWRCYYVKHHKHNTSHHPAVGEGHTHSHPPPVTLCEETGYYYSTPREVAPQESIAAYNHLCHDNTITEIECSENIDMGAYSTLSYRYSQEQSMGADLIYVEVYTETDKKSKKKKTCEDSPQELGVEYAVVN